MSEQILQIIGFLGIGSIIGAYFNSLWEKNKAVSLQKQEYKETRYKTIILLLFAYLEYKDQADFLIIHRPDLKSKDKLSLELIFSMLGEASTVAIARGKDTQGFPENKVAAVNGGSVAGKARADLEQKTGQKVVSKINYLRSPQNKKLVRK